MRTSVLSRERPFIQRVLNAVLQCMILYMFGCMCVFVVSRPDSVQNLVAPTTAPVNLLGRGVHLRIHCHKTLTWGGVLLHRTRMQFTLARPFPWQTQILRSTQPMSSNQETQKRRYLPIPFLLPICPILWLLTQNYHLLKRAAQRSPYLALLLLVMPGGPTLTQKCLLLTLCLQVT